MRSSAEKYASAFCPPKESWRRLRRCCSSPGTSNAGDDSPGCWAVRGKDVAAVNSNSTARNLQTEFGEVKTALQWDCITSRGHPNCVSDAIYKSRFAGRDKIAHSFRGG